MALLLFFITVVVLILCYSDKLDLGKPKIINS